ncbi:hypothetical protein NV115_001957 [Vibrio alginolyticus]|nr:hypothetical protein [Vibrio alginolyticus]
MTDRLNSTKPQTTPETKNAPSTKMNKKETFKKALAHPLTVAFVAALGAGLSNIGIEIYKNISKEDAKFIYVTSQIYNDKGNIVVHNVGDKPGIITQFTFDSNPTKDSILSAPFFSTDTTSDYKLRKTEYQTASALVCPPQKVCEIEYRNKKLSKEFSPKALYIHDGKRKADGTFEWVRLAKGNY